MLPATPALGQTSPLAMSPQAADPQEWLTFVEVPERSPEGPPEGPRAPPVAAGAAGPAEATSGATRWSELALAARLMQLRRASSATQRHAQRGASEAATTARHCLFTGCLTTSLSSL